MSLSSKLHSGFAVWILAATGLLGCSGGDGGGEVSEGGAGGEGGSTQDAELPEVKADSAPDAKADSAPDGKADAGMDAPADQATETGVDAPGCGDLSNPSNCGVCGNDCHVQLLHCAPASVGCTASPKPGVEPGTCTCGSCVPGWWDLDGDGSCEYSCVKQADDDAACNQKDDDCDGVVDEDVDYCAVEDCGGCGVACDAPHAESACVGAGGAACEKANATCVIKSCTCTDSSDCWWDLDQVPSNGCEYSCAKSAGGVEVCDGIDNDCNGVVDDVTSSEACQGGAFGVCAAPEHAGTSACSLGVVSCAGPNVVHPGELPEECNGQDDDCDGMADEQTGGEECGASGISPCKKGKLECQNAQLVCVGSLEPAPEVCDGIDNDCDGVPDDSPSGVGQACQTPPPPPSGATSPCKPGLTACVGGGLQCQGAVGPSSAMDACGDDSNCDGVLTGQPDLQSNVSNCGACGNDCYAGAVHAMWACVSGVCTFMGCEAGHFDLNGDKKCEYACSFVSMTESCNGIDDNCNGQVDESLTMPMPHQVCGTSPGATAPECTSQVQVQCANGGWKCTFPAGVCPGGCSSDDEVCDGLDNDCDGLVNENVPGYGSACASDDGLPPPGHGACRTTGTIGCNGCSATKADCASLPGGCTELCDGVDNDCDGLVDEAFNDKGSNAANFVKPTVTKLAASMWMYTYEASRPTASGTVPGWGNGYWTSAPAGQTLDKTSACSVASKIPWFNVTPQEVEQTCQAMGGAICTTAQFKAACTPNAACTYGYNPRGGAGSACATGYTGTKYCNLGPSFDFNSGVAGDQDGLLPTASNLLQNCWADWSNLQGNLATNNKLFDLTGNLREITKTAQNQYTLMGGAFNTDSEAGASCNFTFYTVDQNYKLFDTGFRCCFTSDPTL